MTNVQEALKVAIEALNDLYEEENILYDKAIALCKSALSEVEKCEPVVMVGDAMQLTWINSYGVNAGSCLYTSPQPRDWVGLSDEQILELDWNTPTQLARVVEAKLKQLNTKG